jgi:hypothetical protein
MATIPAGEAINASAPKPTAKRRHPATSDQVVGHRAVAMFKGTSNATMSRVLIVKIIP